MTMGLVGHGPRAKAEAEAEAITIIIKIKIQEISQNISKFRNLQISTEKQ